jgi:hypothetical protein
MLINIVEGGGVIDIDVARYLHLDGILMSLGGSATGDNSGGGSGGSIHVVAVNFSGHEFYFYYHCQ